MDKNVQYLRSKDKICGILVQDIYLERLEEDDGLDPRNLIHGKFCERGPFFTRYVVCTCSTLCRESRGGIYNTSMYPSDHGQVKKFTTASDKLLWLSCNLTMVREIH